MDFERLKALKPAEYENAATGYRTTSKRASDAKDSIDNRIAAGMRKHLDGESARAALKQLQQLSADFHYAETECGLVSTALDGFAYDMRAAQQKLQAALDHADEAGFTVRSDGSVAFPAGGEKKDGKVPEGDTVTGSPDPYTDPSSQALRRQAIHFHPNPRYGPALDIADSIAQAVKQATTADEKWAPKLRALKADDDLTVSAHDWADAKKDSGGVLSAAKGYLDSIPPPPTGDSPKANAAWWDHLTVAQRADYLAACPEIVGKLDGLPSETRDEANRTVLAEVHGVYATKLDGIPPEPANKYTWINSGGYASQVYTDEWIAWNKKYGDEYRHVTSSLQGMQSIEDRFAETGKNGLPEAYLLGFSPEKNGRAIIATGNPDMADHTAVYVPGTTSNLGNIGGGIDRMNNLWRDADSIPGKTGSLSTITWLGYDAPQNIVKDAPFRHYADDGAPALNNFLDGLHTSRTADGDGHTTVIGHSYGTTLVGSAARQGSLHADDVIFAGSPGVEVGSAQEMDVPKGHVWNEEADGDKVPDIGRFGLGGSQWREGGGVWINPSAYNFGAHQMETDTQGHSGYWNPDSESLRNQAQVVMGRYGNVRNEN